VRQAFTLIELLVVIVIIGILITIVLTVPQHLITKGKITETRVFLTQITQATEAYHDDDLAGAGDYPPTSLRAQGAGTNGVNDGIESLLAHLVSRKGGPFLPDIKPDKQISNTDHDSITGWNPNWIFGDAKARELCDSWGNPLVYFHNRDYKKPRSYMVRYRCANSRDQIVRPQIHKKLGTYPRFSSFMLWSFGPNGKNENGEGDDIANWK